MATAKYSRLRTVLEVSEHSDYSKAQVYQFEATAQTSTKVSVLNVDAVTGTLTVDLGGFSSLIDVMVRNTDPTNFITVTYSYNGNSESTRCLAGNWVKLSFITAASDLLLTADTATCNCDVWLLGT
jgi:hypothetical protein